MRQIAAIVSALSVTAACVFAAQPGIGRVREDLPGTIAAPGQLRHEKLPSRANERTQYLIDRGLNYLKQQQKPDGGWQNENDPPAVTALVLRAFVLHPQYDARSSVHASPVKTHDQPNGSSQPVPLQTAPPVHGRSFVHAVAVLSPHSPAYATSTPDAAASQSFEYVTRSHPQTGS